MTTRRKLVAESRAPLIEQLQGEQVRRLRCIRAVTRLDNAATAMIRRELGWAWDTPEAERAKLNKRAKAILLTIYEGKGLDTLPEDDQRVATIVALEAGRFQQARTPLVEFRGDTEKEMRALASQLPPRVVEWVESVRGFGDLALAVLVGEAGDLGTYPHVDKVWKRFGLTPYNGHAASTWRVKGGLSADEWSKLGYRPARNAETYAVLGDPLFRQQSIIGGPYRGVYDVEKARFLAMEKTKGHAHMHGLRCMRKAAIEDLYRVWRGYPPIERPLALAKERVPEDDEFGAEKAYQEQAAA